MIWHKLQVAKCELRGEPHSDMKNNDDMWVTINLDRKLLHITFILLNPLSQAAVLTAMVETQLSSVLISVELEASWPSRCYLYANLHL